MLESHDEARVFFSSLDVSVTLPQTVDGKVDGRKFHLEILCRESGWHPLPLEQACSSSFPRDLIFPVEHLYILDFGLHNWQDYVESSQRLELLHPFITVKCFYVSQDLVPHIAPRIAPVMQDIGGKRVAEVVPALQTHFFEEQLSSLLHSRPVQESIGKFVAARQLPSHPVTVSRLKRL